MLLLWKSVHRLLNKILLLLKLKLVTQQRVRLLLLDFMLNLKLLKRSLDLRPMLLTFTLKKKLTESLKLLAMSL
jgi:hypothetical protein